MDNTIQPYVNTCPVGCSASLTDTTLALREGLLRRCGECGQLVSRIDEARYWESIAVPELRVHVQRLAAQLLYRK